MSGCVLCVCVSVYVCQCVRERDSYINSKKALVTRIPSNLYIRIYQVQYGMETTLWLQHVHSLYTERYKIHSVITTIRSMASHSLAARPSPLPQKK